MKARDRWIEALEQSNVLFDNLRAVARRSHAQQMEDIATLERDHQRKIRVQMDLEEAREAHTEEDTLTHTPLGGEPREVVVPRRQAQAQGRGPRSPNYLSDRSEE